MEDAESVKIVKNDTKSADDELAEVVRLSLLFDFYGELLTNNNKEIFEDYIKNDMSLSEIAGELGISRQGVHDSIKRSTKVLNDYEKKLGLAVKFKLLKEKTREIKTIACELENQFTDDQELVRKLGGLSDDILNIM
jgi:uncharacterized protein